MLCTVFSPTVHFSENICTTATCFRNGNGCTHTYIDFYIQRLCILQAYGPHPLLRAASPYVPPYYGGPGGPPSMGYPPTAPGPTSAPGGYTLPPTAAYFPITAYTNNSQNAGVDNTQQVMLSQDSLNQQPNTPDLLMHRRAVSFHFFFYLENSICEN